VVRIFDMHRLILEFDSDKVTIVDGKVTVEIDDYSEIRLIPNGIYKGINWFKPLTLTTVKDLVLEKFKEDY
jgi:hypothetical protein